MKTLILYASKHGATEEIARRILKNIDGAEIFNLKETNIPPLSGFECVIFGTSLYAGAMRGEAKAFLTKNADELCTKKLGLFLSGLAETNNFDKTFTPKIAQSAVARATLGGIFDPIKSNLIERIIIKLVRGDAKYLNSIDDKKIEQFVANLKS